MKYISASIAAALIVAASTAAVAQTSGAGGDAPQQECALGYVTGIGGSAQSMREFLATPDRDRYRYLADHPMQCQISDEGRASACTGVTNLRHERASVYDDSGGATMVVVARVELDQGTYPVMIVVSKQDMHCDK